MESHLACDDGAHGMAYDYDTLGIELQDGDEAEGGTADGFNVAVSPVVPGQCTACSVLHHISVGIL